MRAVIREQLEVAIELLLLYVVVFILVVRPDFLNRFVDRSLSALPQFYIEGAAMAVLISFLRALYLLRDFSTRRPEVTMNTIAAIVVGGLLYIASLDYESFSVAIMIFSCLFVTKSVTYYGHRLTHPNGTSSAYYAFAVQYMLVALSAFYLPFVIRFFSLP